jgi:hypothetical protein
MIKNFKNNVFLGGVSKKEDIDCFMKENKPTQLGEDEDLVLLKEPIEDVDFFEMDEIDEDVE